MKIFYSEPISLGKYLINSGVKNFLVTAYKRMNGKLVSDVLGFVQQYPYYNFSECNLLIDSGAHSIFNSGPPVHTVEQYIKECEEFEQKIAPMFKSVYYINYDKIPGKKGMNRPTRRAYISEAMDESFQRYLKIAPVIGKEKVIPVVHYDEDYSLVEQYAVYNPHYICFGPGSSVDPNGVSEWLTQIWLRKPANMKVHGLAATGFKINLNYPFYSVDSKSWMVPALYGNCNYWDLITVKTAKRLKEVSSTKQLNLSEAIINSQQSRKIIKGISSELETEQILYQVRFFQRLEYLVTKRFQHNDIYD